MIYMYECMYEILQNACHMQLNIPELFQLYDY